MFGFLSPNGTGETTTIKMIVRLLQPTSGTIQEAGYDVHTQPLLAKAASGYVPDTPNLYAKLTRCELLRFVGDLYSMDRQRLARRTEELLRVLCLYEAADQTIDFCQDHPERGTATGPEHGDRIRTDTKRPG